MSDKPMLGDNINDMPIVALKLLGNALMQTNDHIIVTDETGAIVYVNPSFIDFTGYKWYELHQQNLRILKSGKHPPQFYADMWQTIQNGEVFRAVFINRKKNGELYHEEKTITPIKDGESHITHFISVGRDITANINLQNRIHALELEKQKVYLQDEFVNSISHDFRTPLTSIQLHLHLLEQDMDDLAHKPRLDVLKSQIYYLNHITENMLVMYRLKEGIVSTFASIDVNVLLQDIVTRLTFLFEQKNLTVKCKYAPSQALIFGNEVLIMRAFSNLIENAIHYTPKGGQIEIHTDVLNNQVIVQICDTGVGIKPENLPHIFEQFYKPEESYMEHGLGIGLGLRIVKRIIDMHNATAQVDSEFGAGTVFTVFLPTFKFGNLLNAASDQN